MGIRNKNIAIYDDKKILLPLKSKFEGVEGMFTTEGFFYSAGVAGIQRMSIDYSEIITVKEDKLLEVYDRLDNEEYGY